jgi:RimJ/RimL family protein N-acetyltransferase
MLAKFRGHGYATEAAGAVIEAAFATGRERPWATVGIRNAPSFRVLEKNGFVAHHNGYGERANSSGWFQALPCDELYTDAVR